MSEVIFLSDVREYKSDINPGWGRSIGPYVLSKKARQAGFSSIVIDHFTSLKSIWEILEKAISHETFFIGFSSTFLSVEINDSKKLSQGIKNYSSGALWLESSGELKEFITKLRSIAISRSSKKVQIAIGGTKALMSIMNSEIRQLFDVFFIGKTESYFDQYLHQIKNEQHVPYQNFENSRYLTENSYNEKTNLILDNIFTHQDAILPNESLPIEIAKGCMYNCKFCHFEKQESFRRNSKNLKEELIRNYEMFGTQKYFFLDDCFNDLKNKVYDICETFLQLPFRIEWVSYARVDVAVRFPDTLDLMVESGARGLFWGLETFDHNVGKKIGKGTDPELVKNMLIELKRKHKNRCLSMGSFIIGLPGESEDSLQKTLDWIIEANALDLVYCPVLSIRPYSEKLDKAVIDYADFSRNPEKYGFELVRFSPEYYWKHSTMDLNRAHEIRLHWRNSMRKARVGQDSFITCIFQYPHARSLGYSHEEVVNLIKNGQWEDPLHLEFVERQKKHLLEYESCLIKSLI